MLHPNWDMLPPVETCLCLMQLYDPVGEYTWFELYYESVRFLLCSFRTKQYLGLLFTFFVGCISVVMCSHVLLRSMKKVNKNRIA
jgi:hypothetical protein